MARTFPPNARVCVAQVGAPHGVRGEVRLKAFTADPAAVAQYGALESEDGARHFRIAGLRPSKDMLVVRFEGVSDRDAAEALRNLRLFVPRERLPPPDEDEFYYADLVGLSAYDTAGAKLGTVVAVQNFGAGDLIELQPEVGTVTVLLPFTKAVVPQIDFAAGRIVVDPPEGALVTASEKPANSRPDGSVP